MQYLLASIVLLLPLAPLWAEPPKVTAQSLRDRARSVLARIDGEVRVPGLTEPVLVLRDRWGVPHIYAKNADDLFFAQGFVVAQDRLFQLDLWRRVATGETAEVLGPQAIEADRFARLIRYRGDRESEWRSYAPDAKPIAAAFTRGINACIDHAGDRLPIEFQLLGLTPKKWRPEDVLGRMSGIIMSRNFQQEIARARLIRAVGLEKARLLAPTDPPHAFAPAPGLDLDGIDERILTGFQSASKVIQFQPGQSESNNWVVSGARSLSGKPLLASDPHRALLSPSLRYLVHLNAPGWNVIGSGEPALPGVAIGHNERIAWGFTIVGTDQADLYALETNSADPTEYRAAGRWEKMRIVREEVRVKGRATAQAIELRFTRHGPVLFQDDKRHRAYALKWAGSEPGGAAYLGSLSVARARNRRQFLDALQAWKIPGLNFVYADVDGDIGWIAAALTPIRKDHDGLLPLPGDAVRQWQGYLAVRDLPQSFNPAAGYLATANHNILPPGYPRAIAYDWAPPYRIGRIREVLQSKEKFSLDDCRALQQDVVSLPGRELVKLLRTIDVPEPALQPHVRRLRQWDGVLSRDSQAGALYAVWLDELLDAFYRRHVPKDLVRTARTLGGVPLLLQALRKPEPRWFGEDPTAQRDRLLRSTLAGAAGRLAKLSTRPDGPRWGELHTATFRHPLAPLGPAYAQAFNVGPFERPGDGYTPNNTLPDDSLQQRHGATYRHLFDLADWDRGLATSAPGQSGQPTSPHYADLAPLWADGRYFPLAYSRRKVEEETRHRLWLKPARAK